MDNIDYEIVKILQDRGRIPVKKISEMVNLTPPAVAERIRRLEETGVILGYRAVLNPNKFGMTIRAIITVTLIADKRKEFLEFAKQNKSILECHHVTGGFSMIIRTIFKEMSDLEVLVGKIQQFGDTQTLIILSSPIEYKGIV